MRLLHLLAAVVLPIVAIAGQALQYEPAVVQVTGTMAKGKHEHPNGSWFDVLILKLDAPASIKADDAKDSFNVGHENITELQVYSNDPAVLKKMGAAAGKKVTLTGTLFHAHTAWHVRDLVLTVSKMQ